jgi:hypothetical protein
MRPNSSEAFSSSRREGRERGRERHVERERYVVPTHDPAKYLQLSGMRRCCFPGFLAFVEAPSFFYIFLSKDAIVYHRDDAEAQLRETAREQVG